MPFTFIYEINKNNLSKALKDRKYMDFHQINGSEYYGPSNWSISLSHEVINSVTSVYIYIYTVRPTVAYCKRPNHTYS